MNNRLKQNRALLPSKRRKTKGNNEGNVYSSSGKKNEPPVFKKVSKEKLIEIKKQIKVRAKKERKKERVFYAIAFIIGVMALIAFLGWIN